MISGGFFQILKITYRPHTALLADPWGLVTPYWELLFQTNCLISVYKTICAFHGITKKKRQEIKINKCDTSLEKYLKISWD
jgi:hypothetical protein